MTLKMNSSLIRKTNGKIHRLLSFSLREVWNETEDTSSQLCRGRSSQGG